MKAIPLTKGKVALVDDCDYEYLMQWKWYYTNNGYAIRKVRFDGKQATVWMHRVVVARSSVDIGGLHVDHINHNRSDNRRENLRSATASENAHNTRKHRDGKSGYKGVTLDKATNLWNAHIQTDKKVTCLGRFDTAEQAAAAYDKAAVILHNEFACLNGVDVPFTDPRGMNRRNTSGFRGVSRRGSRWVVHIFFSKKQIHVGVYSDKIEAALAYNQAALFYYGPDAYLNDPSLA